MPAATQATAPTVGTNQPNMVENRRELMAHFGNDLLSYVVLGEGAPMNTGDELKADYYVPDRTKHADLKGIRDDNDAKQKTQKGYVMHNQTQLLVSPSEVQIKTTGTSTPGMQGDRSFQEKAAMKRIMKLINDAIASNRASIKETKAVAGEAGTPLTYLKASANIANKGNDTVTVAGYNFTKNLSVAAIDQVTDGNAGTVSLYHIMRLVQNTKTAMAGYLNKEGNSTPQFFVFLPSETYLNIVNSSNLGSMGEINRIYSGMASVGGNDMGVMLDLNLVSLTTNWGDVFDSVDDQVGIDDPDDKNDTANNDKLTFVMLGGTAKVCYFREPGTRELHTSHVNDQLSTNAVFSFYRRRIKAAV